MIVHPMLLQCQTGGSFGLTVSVAETSSPAASDYARGESIYYDITITATGSEVYNIVIEDLLTGDMWTPQSLIGSDTYGSNGHAVTETDIINGYVSATISVTYEDLDGNQYSTSAVLTIQNIEAPNAELTVTLSTDKASYTTGETVIGSATVQNTGNLTISTIQCAAFADSFTLNSLQPGQSNTTGGLLYPVSTAGTQTFTSTTTGTPPTGTTLSVNEGSVSVSVAYVFSYKINTQATTSGAKDGAIPFNLSNISSASTMTVDWGDGTTSALKASDYGSNYSNGTASIHTYATAGEYTIRVTYDGDWSATSLGWFATSTANLTPSNSNARTKFIGVFNSTLIAVLTPLPSVSIIRYYSNATTTGAPSTASDSVSHMFRYCTKLVSVPETLFVNLRSATTSAYTFCACSSLASIPAKLLEPLTNTTTMQSLFYGCSSIASIPAGLLDKNTAVTSLASLFNGCESVTSIPAGLFNATTKVTSISSLFYGCNNSQLTTLPAGLFDKFTEVTNMQQVFYGMSRLESVPAGLFDKMTKLTNASYAFCNCSRLASVNTALFKFNTLVTNFSYVLRSCSALTTLPSDLFQYNTAATNFKNALLGATSLGGFDIHIGSTKVSSGNAASFVTKNTSVTRIVRVPSGSTTQTTFNSVASSLGLTVIGE